MQALSPMAAWRALLGSNPKHDTPQQILKSALATGFFIGLFLVIFRPFGMAENIAGYQWLMIASFGPLNTVLILVNELGLKRLLQRMGALRTKSRIANVVWFAWSPFLIAFGNYFYFPGYGYCCDIPRP